MRWACLALMLIGVIGCQHDEDDIDTPPIVISFTPAQGFAGTQVTITGANFGPTPHVYLNDVEMNVDHVADNQLRVTVPVNASTGPIRVENSAGGATTNQHFSVVVPVVRPISIVRAYDADGDEPEFLTPGQTIYFEVSGSIDDSKISFDGRALLNIRRSAINGWLAEVPFGVKTGQFSITAYGLTKFYDKLFTVMEGKGEWRLEQAYPEETLIIAPAYFGIQQRFYIGIGPFTQNSPRSLPEFPTPEFYTFDLVAGSWIELPDFPGTTTGPDAEAGGIDVFSFAVGDYGYVGGGRGARKKSHQLFRFDPLARTWTQLDSLRDQAARATIGFVVGDSPYILNTEDGTYFSYDVVADTFLLEGNSPVQFQSNGDRLSQFVHHGKAYFVLSTSDDRTSTLWEFDPGNNQWVPLQNLSYGEYYSVVIDDQIYLGSGSRFGRYDISSGILIQLPSPPVRLHDARTYSALGNGYFFTSRQYLASEPGFNRLYRFRP